MALDPHLAEIDAGPLHVANNTSVFSHLQQGLRKNPHKPAVICMHQPANHLSNLVAVDESQQQKNGDHHRIESIDCLTLSYTQVHRAALILAAGFIANGVRPGSTVLMLIPNGGEYGVLLWTWTIMRLTFTALGPSALDASGNTEELRNVVETLKPGLIIVPDAPSAVAVDNVIFDTDLGQPLRISLDGSASTSNGWKSLSDIAASGSRSPADETTLLEAARNDDPNRIHSVLFTSGTSAGRPKGCPLRVGSMTHILHSQSWLVNPDNCSLALQQAHNSRAIGPAQTLQTWREGGAVVMPRTSFVIKDTLDAIVQHRVTFIVLTPAMVHGLAQELSSRPGTPLDSVRTIQVGGDAVTKDVLMKCAALFPSAKVCINHGMSEGGGFFTWPFFNTPIPRIPFFGEICPVGAVASGTIVRIWDGDGRRVAKRGEAGELHVCCKSIIQHYLSGAAESSFYEDEKGRWFNTGDIAMVDDEGLIFILGRSKDMIKRNGIAIMPAALESCIEKFTGEQTSVVAIPHPVLGHEPFAMLSNFNGKTEDEIKNHVLRNFGKDYTLGGLASLKQIGFREFPVNATHKVIKFELETAVIEHLKRVTV